MSSAYFSTFILLPDVITEAGRYVTRSGETVIITEASKKHDFGCVGVYMGRPGEDLWHKSGRLYAGQLSTHDIVGRAS